MMASASKRQKTSGVDFEAAFENGAESASGDHDLHASQEPRQSALPREKSSLRHTGPAVTLKPEEYSMYAGGMHKSQMFELQIDKLVTQMQQNYAERAEGIDRALRLLKQSIELVEDCEPISVAEAAKRLQSHKIMIPYPDPQPDINAAYKLHYKKPSKVNVVGSYVLKTQTKLDVVSPIDMIVTMPSSIFQDKDYLDYRYFYKRAYYLASLAAGLQKSLPDQFFFRYDAMKGNRLHPILVATHKANELDPVSCSAIEIHIIPAAPKDFFADAKMRPDRNSIRLPKLDIKTKELTLLPSPFYNSSLKADCNVESYLRLLHSASEASVHFKHSCTLGRIWLRQRGFNGQISDGGFGHFEWAALTACLLKGGGPKGLAVISAANSRYQMFKSVIQFIAASDLISKPMLYEAGDVQFSRLSVPMFYDGPRGQNILYKMKPWSYQLLRQEARTSLAMLSDQNFESFDSAFITRVDQALHRFDCTIRVPFIDDSVSEASCDYEPPVSSFSNRLYDIMREGLSDRVSLVTLEQPSTSSWSVKHPRHRVEKKLWVLVGLVFNATNVGRLVDHGPSADDKAKAQKFRKFWGEKAELRRFKDGSILESLIWSADSDHAVLEEIVIHLIARHFGTETSNGLAFAGNGFYEFSRLIKSDAKAFNGLRQAFQQLEQIIREVEGLPLRPRQVSAIDSQLRYSSIQAPYTTATRTLQTPADILIQFEGSGRWPDDLLAIQRTKVAFLLKVGSLLHAANNGTITRLGLENSERQCQNCAFLDIVTSSGAAFRLRIHHDREQILLERQMQDKTISHRARDDVGKALTAYKYLFIQLPRHSQTITTQCTRFPLLSQTIRLIKQWFDRHMLSRHFSPALLELLAARAFLHPYPWQPPSCAMTGFLRTLLFISKWDWRSQPLIVDFNGSMTSTEYSSVKSRLDAWRKIDPGMNRVVLVAATNDDLTGTSFTESRPSKVVASRMTALASVACKLVKKQGLELKPRMLFAASTEEFDFVIKLESKFMGMQTQKQTPNEFKNMEMQSHDSKELVGYKPVEMFVSELETLYPTSIVFFHSELVGNVVAGLWNPSLASPRSFKVNLPYVMKPIVDQDDDGRIELDKSAILSDIARIGGDMVVAIEMP